MLQGRSFIGQGSNSALVGDFNARVILAALRRFGPASKAELSRRVGLTHNAIGMIARRLEQDGLLRPVGKRQGERGQPATILELNPEGAFSIGVRLDRAGLETVLVDLRGTILDRDRRDTLPEPEAAVAHLVSRIAAMQDRLGPAGRARMIGIGVAAPYDIDSWLLELDLPQARFRRWGGFDLADALGRATGHPVVSENDSSAAAVGELIYGRGRQLGDFLYVFVGAALGGGLVMGGNYLRGQGRNAADIGVVPVGPSALASAPPDATILMARASVNALARHLRYHGTAISAGEDWGRVIAAHPQRFAEWAEDAAAALAVPVLTAGHLLDIGHVVIGGDLPAAGLEAIALQLGQAMRRVVAERRVPPLVLTGAVGPWAAAVGAASLPLHDSFSPSREGLTTQQERPA